MTRILGLLGGFPWTLLVLAGVAGWGLYGHWRAHDARTALAEYIADSNRAARIANDEQRDLENWRQQALQEVTRAQALSRARAAAGDRSAGLAAADSERRLRDAAAARRPASGPAGQDSAAAAQREAAAAAYEQLFLACTAEHRQLAADATADLAAARGSGLECEQSYDAATLTKKP